MTKGKLGVVVDTDEQELCSVVETFGEASITNCLNVGNVGSCDELFQLSKIVGLSVRIDKLRIDEVFLHSLAGHLEVGNEFGPNLCFVSFAANHNVFAGIFRIDE
jgi:hypothetical protein